MRKRDANQMHRPGNNEQQRPEERGYNQHQTQITQYATRNINIVHKGYVDTNKLSENTRILTLNPNGINPWDNIQINMLTNAIETKQIDIALFNETNMKWTPANLDKIEKEMRNKYREVKVIGSDSKQWQLTNNNYLPGGLLTIIKGKCRALLQESQTHVNKYGNWMATTFSHNNKAVVVINLYRIPTSSSKGPRCCQTQYNIINGNMKSSTQYRKEILQQIKNYIQTNQFNDIIIAGDFNQNIASNEIKQFCMEIGVKDIHSMINNINIEELDNTNINGKHPIDSIAASHSISEYIEGCQVVQHNEILYSDHRGYMVDVNFEGYFNDHLSSWDEHYKTILNPSRKSHREKFANIIEEQIDMHNLSEMIEDIRNNPINGRIEMVDETITRIFNKARKKVEGIHRRVPYSTDKARARETISIWKTVIRKLNNKMIDECKLQAQIAKWNIVINENETIESAAIKLNEAKQQWNEVKVKGKEYREKYLLDHHHSAVDETNQNHQKTKQKLIKTIAKQQKRANAFKYLTKHVGKGVKGNLKRLHIVNEEDKIVRTIIEKEQMEKEIMEYNVQHFKQAHNSEIYNDKIYAELHNNEIRDRILNGQLRADECDSQKVWSFLKLLEVPTTLREQVPSQGQYITKEQWIDKVKKAKKQSASSIFSNRTYATYKCALSSEKMTEILVEFYNIIIEVGYYPKRWQNIVDIMLEKGKGPKLGKLRTITLIEGDLQILMRIFMDGKNNELIESDPRFSKANYGSRKNYSIESALLEKRLIFDHSALETTETIYNFTDLEACYD